MGLARIYRSCFDFFRFNTVDIAFASVVDFILRFLTSNALPTHADHLPTHDDHQPTHDDHLPTHDDHQPTHADHLPTHDDHLPTHDDHLPTHDDHLPTHDDHLPTHDDHVVNQSIVIPDVLYGAGCSVYTSDTLSLDNIVDILKNPNQSRISDVPPVKPSAGDSYLISCHTQQDWSCDQYQWVQVGRIRKEISNDVLIKTYYSIRVPGFKEGKGRSRPNFSSKFKRTAYYLQSVPGRVLVIYEGDEKIYVPLPHGNSKSETAVEREFVKTCKSVINEIKETSGKPMTVYRKMVCKDGVEGSHHGVLNPRNLRQIKNHQAKTKAEKSLGKDDIYNLIQLAYHVEGFVGEITVYPDLVTVFALPELIHTFQELIQSNTTSPVCLVYDTTFNLGDFYVSPLVFRHVLFEESPWIPLAFLIHDRKLQKCHNRLFEFIADKIPVLKCKNIPFITDREPALTKAVLLYFPNMTVLHCWNHIRRDFKEELRKQGAESSEMTVYLSQWKQMSQCNSEDEFVAMYDDVSSKWTQSVKTYFDKNIKGDILNYSGKWIIDKFHNLYDPYSGITNNPSESINSVLKRMTGWQELPVDTMMLSLYHLQNYYHAEIQRGRADIGNYHLKSKYRQAKIDRDELHLPKKLLEPEDIIQYVKTQGLDNVKSEKSSANAVSKSLSTDVAESSSNTKSSVTDESSPVSLSKSPLISPPKSPLSPSKSPLSPLKSPPILLNATPKSSGLDFNDSDLQPSPISPAPTPPTSAPAFDKNMSQKSMARYVIDNDGVTHVPGCQAFVVKGNNDKNYCVSLNPESCQCPSSSTCYHILAVKMFVGLPIDETKREVNLRTLSKRSLKRSDKKSGRKKPRANDLDPDIVPAPDSIIKLGTSTTAPKTPKSKKKLRFQDKELPAKKRKLQYIEEPDSPDRDRWVGTLKNEHKQKILENKDLCSDIMQTVQNILRRQFPDINGMQPTTNAPVWNENENRWRNEIPFSQVTTPAAQIHHTGRHHWVTSINLNGQINILDSQSKGTLTPSLEIQLTSLYGNACAFFPVKIPPIQQQNNNHDCGVYAIANLTQFCFGGYDGTQEIQYNDRYMRDHLIYCLERQQFVPFPRVQTKATKKNRKKSRTATIACDCPCGKPNSMEAMVGCDGLHGTCTSWRHKSCANISTLHSHEDWYCTPHREKV